MTAPPVPENRGGDEVRRGPGALVRRILRRFPPLPPPPSRRSDAKIADLLGGMRGARVLDVGSGTWRRAPHAVNMDVEPYPHVDVIGDAQELPFRSGVFDLVCCSSTLEHLHFPDRVISEIRRVLQPGGTVFVETPFVYPFHGDDATGERDYRRMAAGGLRHALRDFRQMETGQSVGPASTMALLLAEFLALFFASRRHTALYYSVRNLVGWILLPWQFLDPWLARKNFSYRIAGGFYFVGQKDGPPAAESDERE